MAINQFKNLPDETTPITAESLNEMQNVELLAVSDEAPVDYEIGDKYYNTTDKVIYTASESGWEEVGEKPIHGVFYIVLEDTMTYYYDIKNDNLISVGGGASGGSEPVGSIKLWAGTNAPKNYLICEGQAISRSIYADLFNIIGETYGAGDGSTTFNIPDYRGLVPVGLKVNEEYFNELGKTGGTIKHKHILPLGAESASFYMSINEEKTSLNIEAGKYNTNWSGNTSSSINAISSREELTLQPYIVQNYIIKVSKEATEETLVEAVPVGTILDYDGDTVPVGYEEIEEKINILWENQNPSARFPAQTITLNDNYTNYKYLEIIIACYLDDGYRFSTGKIPTNASGTIFSLASNVNRERYFKFKNNNQIEITAVSEYSFNGTKTTNTDLLAPVQIIGYKEV